MPSDRRFGHDHNLIAAFGYHIDISRTGVAQLDCWRLLIFLAGYAFYSLPLDNRRSTGPFALRVFATLIARA